MHPVSAHGNLAAPSSSPSAPQRRSKCGARRSEAGPRLEHPAAALDELLGAARARGRGPQQRARHLAQRLRRGAVQEAPVGQEAQVPVIAHLVFATGVAWRGECTMTCRQSRTIRVAQHIALRATHFRLANVSGQATSREYCQRGNVTTLTEAQQQE